MVGEGFVTISDLNGRRARLRASERAREYFLRRVGSTTDDYSGFVADRVKIALSASASPLATRCNVSEVASGEG